MTQKVKNLEAELEKATEERDEAQGLYEYKQSVNDELSEKIEALEKKIKELEEKDDDWGVDIKEDCK